MKSHFRTALFALFAILLLVGCSFSGPPNIPSTGGTPRATAGTPGAGYAYPVGTATQAARPTNTIAVVTATTGAPTTAGPTAAAPTTAAPTTAAAATATKAPTSAPAATNTVTAGGGSDGSSGGTTGGGAAGSIPLPANRTPIQFAPNTTSSVVNTTLQSGVVQGYQVSASSGQRMFITIDGNASMQLYDRNLNALSGVLTAINPVQISLSQAGNNYIALQGTGPVTMSVYIPPLNGNQNVSAPVPATLNPIQFQTGASSTNFSVNAVAGTPLGYSINVQAGQRMTVTTNGNATFTLLAPDKSTMVPSGNAPTHQWIYPLSQNGAYTLVLLGSGPVNVTISIPPLSGNIPSTGGTGTPVPVPGSPTRVTFAPGNASTRLNANLAAGTPQGYVLNVQAGQTLYVSTTGKVDTSFYGPDGNLISSGHADFPNRWSVKASQTGDYTFVIQGNGASQLVFYVPPQ